MDSSLRCGDEIEKAGMTNFLCHSKQKHVAVSSRVWNPCSKDCFVSELSGFEGKGMDPSLRWDDGEKRWDDGIKRWDDDLAAASMTEWRRYE